MKAAVFRGPRDVRVEEVEKPQLLPGDVLVRIRACGICGSDLHVYKYGLYAQTIGVPVPSGFVLGHEWSGEVVKINGEIKDLQVGDRVSCAALGANAEYVRVPAAQVGLLLHTPSDISDEEAATCEPLTCSLCAVDRAAPKDGQGVVVIGLGIIGLGIVQVLKALHSMKTIVGIDLSEKRMAMARQVGADGVVSARNRDSYRRVLELAGSVPSSVEEWRAAGADVVFECAGLTREQKGPAPLQQAILMTKQGGKVMLLSVSERPVEIEANLIMSKGINVAGSPGWGWTGEDFGKALELMRGTVDRKRLITHQFPLGQAADAYETQLNADESIKVLIRP